MVPLSEPYTTKARGRYCILRSQNAAAQTLEFNDGFGLGLLLRIWHSSDGRPKHAGCRPIDLSLAAALHQNPAMSLQLRLCCLAPNWGVLLPIRALCLFAWAFKEGLLDLPAATEIKECTTSQVANTRFP